MDRSNFLDNVKNTLSDREMVYGSPRESFERIASMWSGVLGVHVDTTQVAQCMIALKICRGTQFDSWVDIAGYATIGAAELNEREPLDADLVFDMMGESVDEDEDEDEDEDSVVNDLASALEEAETDREMLLVARQYAHEAETDEELYEVMRQFTYALFSEYDSGDEPEPEPEPEPESTVPETDYGRWVKAWHKNKHDELDVGPSPQREGTRQGDAWVDRNGNLVNLVED